VFAQAIAGIVMRGFAELNRARGMVQGNFSTIMKIQQALEREGISFIAEPGGGFGTSLTAANELAIRRALEAAGVEFIDENGGGAGMRLRNRQGPKQPK
jgi:hypothetical protein